MTTAIDLIKKKDLEYGESWSDDSAQIADLMDQYRNDLKDEILFIMRTGMPNRKQLKRWEAKIINICELK